jgi:hypothetical protein
LEARDSLCDRKTPASALEPVAWTASPGQTSLLDLDLCGHRVELLDAGGNVRDGRLDGRGKKNERGTPANCAKVDRNKVTRRPGECCGFSANCNAKPTPENECTIHGDIHKLTGVLHLLPQIEPSYCHIQLVTL